MRFESISERIFALSPWDGAELPTIQAYPFCAGVLDMDEETFQSYLAYKLSIIKREIISERIRKNG